MAASLEAVAELQRMLEMTRQELAAARKEEPTPANATRIERLETTLHEQTLLVSRALAAIALAGLPPTPQSPAAAATAELGSIPAEGSSAGRWLLALPESQAGATRPEGSGADPGTSAAPSSSTTREKPSKAETLGSYVERRKQYSEAVEYCREHKCGGKKAMQSGRFPLCNAKGIQDRLSGRVNHENTFEKRRILTHAEEEHLAHWMAQTANVPDENNKRQKRQLHKKYICELLCKRKARFQSSNHTEGLKLSDVAEQALLAGGPDKRWFQRFFQKWIGVIQRLAGVNGDEPSTAASASVAPASASVAVDGEEQKVQMEVGAPGGLQAEIMQAAMELPKKAADDGSAP